MVCTATHYIAAYTVLATLQRSDNQEGPWTISNTGMRQCLAHSAVCFIQLPVPLSVHCPPAIPLVLFQAAFNLQVHSAMSTREFTSGNEATGAHDRPQEFWDELVCRIGLTRDQVGVSVVGVLRRFCLCASLLHASHPLAKGQTDETDLCTGAGRQTKGTGAGRQTKDTGAGEARRGASRLQVACLQHPVLPSAFGSGGMLNPNQPARTLLHHSLGHRSTSSWRARTSWPSGWRRSTARGPSCAGTWKTSETAISKPPLVGRLVTRPVKLIRMSSQLLVT